MRIGYFLVFFFLLSCSKSKRIVSKIHGDWKVTSVHVENGQGFLFRDSLPIGIVNIDVNSKSITGKINFQTKNISGQITKDSLSLDPSKFKILNQNDLLEIHRKKDTLTFRVVQLTSYDLQLEYYDFSSFSLKKITFIKLK